MKAANRVKMMWMKWYVRHSKSELTIFFWRNKIYLFISMICVLLYIKNTNVPFFWKYNTLTKFMFCRPQEGTVWSEAFNFFNQLGFAFIASFVFYLFVDYFPKRRRCKSVFGLISEKVETIDRLFGELFSFLMFITETGTNIDQFRPDMVPHLCGIRFCNKDINCHTKITWLADGAFVEEGNPDVINMLSGPRNFSLELIRCIDSIAALPYVSSLDEKLLDLFLTIKRNRMLDTLAAIPVDFFMTQNNAGYICAYQPQDVAELFLLFLELRTYPYRKICVVTEAAAPEEIQKAKENWAHICRDYPDSVKMMENYKQFLR